MSYVLNLLTYLHRYTIRCVAASTFAHAHEHLLGLLNTQRTTYPGRLLDFHFSLYVLHLRPSHPRTRPPTTGISMRVHLQWLFIPSKFALCCKQVINISISHFQTKKSDFFWEGVYPLARKFLNFSRSPFSTSTWKWNYIYTGAPHPTPQRNHGYAYASGQGWAKSFLTGVMGITRVNFVKLENMRMLCHGVVEKTKISKKIL